MILDMTAVNCMECYWDPHGATDQSS